jgi:hypothetical protein
MVCKQDASKRLFEMKEPEPEPESPFLDEAAYDLPTREEAWEHYQADPELQSETPFASALTAKHEYSGLAAEEAIEGAIEPEELESPVGESEEEIGEEAGEFEGGDVLGELDERALDEEFEAGEASADYPTREVEELEADVLSSGELDEEELSDEFTDEETLGERETQLPPEKLAPFEIRGGLYSPQWRKRELAADGIILTANRVGKEEKRLASKSPFPIKITKEIAQLEGGRFNRWVQKYNAFTIYFEEVLRQIGRLRDLLSVGAPGEPKAMSDPQRASVYRKPGMQIDRDKKDAYRQWRVAPDSAQKNYLQTVSALARAYSEVDRQRGLYWEALAEFEKTIMQAKGLKKPVFEDAFPSLADLIGTMTGSAKAGAASGAAIMVDWYLEVRKMRQDYDEKLRRFLDDFKMIKDAKAYDLMKIDRAGNDYWQSFSDRGVAAKQLEQWRSETRQKAALFGEALGSNKLYDTVKAQLRMPPLVSDAWYALAKLGPEARSHYDKVMKERDFLQWAMPRYKKRRDFGFEDIDEVFIAFRRTFSWNEVLTNEAIAGWKAKDELWEKMWKNFNV